MVGDFYLVSASVFFAFTAAGRLKVLKKKDLDSSIKIDCQIIVRLREIKEE